MARKNNKKSKNNKKGTLSSSVNGKDASNNTTATTNHTPPPSLNDLPREILGEILYYVDLDGIGECLRINKRFYDLLCSDANHIYRGFRKRLGLPDPAIFPMNEASYIRTIFGPPICSDCRQMITDEDFLNLNPIWEFGGVLLCRTCFPTNTVRTRDLREELDERQYGHLLPCYLGYYCEMFYLKRQVIYDRIPDDKELEELKRRKEELEDAVNMLYELFDDIPKIWETYRDQQLENQQIFVYKWLMYKYPHLDEELLESLPELDDVIEREIYNLDTPSGREYLETIALTFARKKIKEWANDQLIQVFKTRKVLERNDVSVNDQIEQWKSYNPFWKNGLLANNTVPTTEDIIAAIAEHQEGFANYMKDMGKRIEMMVTYAHDLGSKQIAQLMKTDAYKELNEDEFIKECESIRPYDGPLGRPIRYHCESNCESNNVFISFLCNEIHSSPLYDSDNRRAFAKFVKQVLAKQDDYIKLGKEYVRSKCANDDVFELTMAMGKPYNSYFKFLELRINSSGVVDEKVNIESDDDDDNDINSYNYAKSARIFSCRKSGSISRFESGKGWFNQALSHVSKRKERNVEDIVVDEKWLSSATLVANWYAELSKITNSWSIEEKLMAKHLFWKTEDTAINFVKFRNHVKRCNQWFVNDRKDYQTALEILTDDGPLDDSNDITSLKSNVLFDFATHRDLLKLKFDYMLQKIHPVLEGRIDSFRARRPLCDYVLQDFINRCEELEDNNVELETLEEIEEALLDLADEVEEKWKVADKLCAEYELEFDTYDTLGDVLRDLCSATMDMDSIKDTKPWLRALRKVKKIINEFIPRIKAKLARQFGVSIEFLEEYENENAFRWKYSWRLPRCSLNDYIGKMIAQELDGSEDKELGISIIGEFTASLYKH